MKGVRKLSLLFCLVAPLIRNVASVLGRKNCEYP